MNHVKLSTIRSASSLRILACAAAAALNGSLAQAETPKVATKDFIAAAAQSDHFEVLEARTALAQTSDPRIRAFAQHMIEDHTQTGEALQQAAMKSGAGAVPQGLGGDQQRLLSALQGQSGPEFNRTYAKQQVLAHQQALVVEQAYADHGSNPNIQAAARSSVPIIQRHLEMAQQLRDQFGGG